MFARLLSTWDHENSYSRNRPNRLPPPVKDYKLARAKRRKQKRKTGGPR